MPVPQLDSSTGLPPLGRYACSLQEFEADFVTSPWASTSATRSAIWAEFWTATKLIVDATAPTITHSAWVGGSYVSSKLDPDDIDVTYLFDGRVYDSLPTSKKRRLELLSSKDHMRKTTGLRVEPFILVTRLIPDPSTPCTSDEATYYMTRGSWDDFWQRCRMSADKTTRPTMDDAQPRRGYLEVTW